MIAIMFETDESSHTKYKVMHNCIYFMVYVNQWAPLQFIALVCSAVYLKEIYICVNMLWCNSLLSCTYKLSVVIKLCTGKYKINQKLRINIE